MNLSRYTVVVTVRSEEKGRRLLNSYKGTKLERVSFVVVEDIVKEGAFDEAVKSDPPFEYVIHTASPYHLNPQDPVKDFLDPAIKGTKGLLRSVKAYAPTVKRVVFTSSSAAVLNPGGSEHHDTVYDETCWAPMTWGMALIPKNAYRASKVRYFLDLKHPSC
jgi:nucleoside-diphosphate-sugar epimerase